MFFHCQSHFCTQINFGSFDSKSVRTNFGPLSHKNGTASFRKKLLIPIPWFVNPDPGAVMPDSSLLIPDPTPLIPDPIYLVTTLYPAQFQSISLLAIHGTRTQVPCQAVLIATFRSDYEYKIE